MSKNLVLRKENMRLKTLSYVNNREQVSEFIKHDKLERRVLFCAVSLFIMLNIIVSIMLHPLFIGFILLGLFVVYALKSNIDYANFAPEQSLTRRMISVLSLFSFGIPFFTMLLIKKRRKKILENSPMLLHLNSFYQEKERVLKEYNTIEITKRYTLDSQTIDFLRLVNRFNSLPTNKDHDNFKKTLADVESEYNRMRFLELQNETSPSDAFVFLMKVKPKLARRLDDINNVLIESRKRAFDLKLENSIDDTSDNTSDFELKIDNVLTRARVIRDYSNQAQKIETRANNFLLNDFKKLPKETELRRESEKILCNMADELNKQLDNEYEIVNKLLIEKIETNWSVIHEK